MFNPQGWIPEALLPILIAMLGGVVRQLYVTTGGAVHWGVLFSSCVTSGFVGYLMYMALLGSIPNNYLIVAVGVAGWASTEVLKLATHLLLDRIRDFVGGKVDVDAIAIQVQREHEERRLRSRREVDALQAEILGKAVEQYLGDGGTDKERRL